MKNSCLLVGILFTLVISAFSDTILVPGDEPTIQAGIDAAAEGDTVLVAPGVYKGEGNRNILIDSKWVVLKSEAGPERTIIDCENVSNGITLRYLN